MLDKWIPVVLFALLVSSSYVCYALVFRSLGGQMVWRLDVMFGILTNPLFIFGLTLSFGSTLVRLALFSEVGIAQTVLVSELSVVMMLALSLIVFGESMGAREILGSVLILIGVALVG